VFIVVLEKIVPAVVAGSVVANSFEMASDWALYGEMNNPSGCLTPGSKKSFSRTLGVIARTQLLFPGPRSARMEATAPQGSTGLFHVAILYLSRKSLAEAFRRLIEAGIPLDGASDHGVSEALNQTKVSGVFVW
jgi:hypothetical protein